MTGHASKTEITSKMTVLHITGVFRVRLCFAKNKKTVFHMTAVFHITECSDFQFV